MDDARALVAQDSSRLTRGNVALEDVQIRAADGRLSHPDDCIRGRGDLRLLTLLQHLLACTQIDQSLHLDILGD